MNKTKMLAGASMLAAMTAFGSMSALAFPQGGPGFGGIESAVLRPSVHTALGLDTTQEAAWQQLNTDAQTVEENLETLHDNTATLIATELAKATPDLSVIVGLENSGRAAADALIRTLQQKELAFYGTLSAAQQALVITAIRNRPQGGPGHRGRG